MKSKAPRVIPDEPAPIFEGFSNETFKFLHGLKKHNNKEWFEAHRDDYERHLCEPSKALAYAMGRYFKEHDLPLVGNAKTSLFRINRDIRFSKDKSPYKTHIGLSFPLEGTKKEEWCGYYIGFEPAKTGKGMHVYVGGGVYMPMPPQLKRIRAKIASNHKELTKIIGSPAFKRLYPKGLEGESLKRIPIGYEEGHPAAQWLKLKSFLFGFDLADSELLNEELPDVLGKKFKVALPVVLFLGSA
ncbi:MAG: DUF2461 domain-containing protein [Bacteroidota bacterium]|nr:DUF2461 domain-containing protein [Bacteroidota bacterium]MDP4231985.1 DUF2461 domain-containing protein [Bacteroidota bacterium]MDP4241308.1 DUF2461 domain-containing protein [Bacteroidota bacterium]MDP4287229.1 DUF2461 domain-containing protein [Bacteroidota bacterium]